MYGKIELSDNSNIDFGKKVATALQKFVPLFSSNQSWNQLNSIEPLYFDEFFQHFPIAIFFREIEVRTTKIWSNSFQIPLIWSMSLRETEIITFPVGKSSTNWQQWSLGTKIFQISLRKVAVSVSLQRGVKFKSLWLTLSNWRPFLSFCPFTKELEHQQHLTNSWGEGGDGCRAKAKEIVAWMCLWSFLSQLWE